MKQSGRAIYQRACLCWVVELEFNPCLSDALLKFLTLYFQLSGTFLNNPDRPLANTAETLGLQLYTKVLYPPKEIYPKLRFLTPSVPFNPFRVLFYLLSTIHVLVSARKVTFSKKSFWGVNFINAATSATHQWDPAESGWVITEVMSWMLALSQWQLRHILQYPSQDLLRGGKPLGQVTGRSDWQGVGRGVLVMEFGSQ